MSQLKVNALVSYSGNTVTLGTSGDTINVASGVTLTNNGTASGFGLTLQSVQTTSFTASAGKVYPINTTSAAITVTLPITPNIGDQIQIFDYAGTADTNNIIINPNGNKIEGVTFNLQLSGEREGVTLTYIDSTQGWLATSGINEGTDALAPAPLDVEYLVVAGGGGAGFRHGGGGAGGFRTGTLTSLAQATNFTVTVGGGGAAVTNDSGTSGSNSVFSTITSNGGGGGTKEGNNGLNGGSGGGAGHVSSGGAGGTGGLGNTPSTVPSQGNNGGNGLSNTPAFSGGGGGGASAVGSNAISTGGGNGGNGSASSITGSSVTYAGGGGGGAYQGSTSATGGTGGGGNAGATGGNNNGSPGGTNTGGGGGGGNFQSSNPEGGSGGSGIVILKYPDAYTISNPGGGLTSSTPAASGGFKITSFTAGTGNVQWNL